jgi:hypothetical protein
MKRAVCGIRWGCWPLGRRTSVVLCSGVLGCGRGICVGVGALCWV